MPPVEAAELLGHTPQMLLATYAHVVDRDAADARLKKGTRLTPLRLWRTQAWCGTGHLTCELFAEHVRVELDVRCRAGGDSSGAGETPHGPLFIAVWRVPALGTIAFNGEHLAKRQERGAWKSMRAARGRRQLGPDAADEGVETSIGLLALLVSLPSEYPDFMVRCPDHGDAVVDRLEVLTRLRSGDRSMKVDTSFPRCAYTKPREWNDEATRRGWCPRRGRMQWHAACGSV